MTYAKFKLICVAVATEQNTFIINDAEVYDHFCNLANEYAERHPKIIKCLRWYYRNCHNIG